MFSFLPNSRLIGIDIQDHAVKVAAIQKNGRSFEVKSVNEVELPHSPWLKNGIRGKTALAAAIRTALDKAKPQAVTSERVICALPESAIFSKVISIPQLNKIELAQTIPYEAADFLPLPLDEVYLDWQIDSTPVKTKSKKNKNHVLVIAAPKQLVNDLLDVCAKANIKLKRIESEPFSVCRSVQHLLTEPGAHVIIDIDTHVTTITIANKFTLKFTSTVLLGSRKLTKHPDNSVVLAEEITESIRYYQNRLGYQEPISGLIITGEGAMLKDIDQRLAALTNLPCVIGHAAIRLPNGRAVHPRFNTVIGLALQGVI